MSTGKIRFLVLDEVLSALDKERCDAVKHIFADVQRRGIFDQIVMITHLESVKHGWPGTILEFSKNGEKTSMVTALSPHPERDPGCEQDQWNASSS
ncbi:hypothetical protein KSF_104010 [Reticulibacter mediterranei]|uniref:RecF/RecN/SMC N-terminal domain-containing protein n=2 Tax=Reticulibacter mediterranei TaxID=2778369 RepID=A0A8J3ITP9_9CHLR|nr:hypothetical protein KSF_104010 [Reticulibacter mediterranei]